VTEQSKLQLLNHIADVLTIHIPNRPAKPKRIRKTWHLLDLEREIENTLPVVFAMQDGEIIEDLEIAPGHIFRIIMVDEAGVWLRMIDTNVKVRLEDKKWKTKFRKHS